MHRRTRQLFSALLASAMVVTTAFSGYRPAMAKTKSVETQTVSVSASTETTVNTATEYGLAEKVEDGVILHCWNWPFSKIKEELPKIAEAGFTAVQTSPIQPNKDGNNGVSGTGEWWKFYQPTDFTIGNALGSKEDFTSLCTEADKYGIKVVVDVVANHLANNSGGANTYAERCTQIPSYIRDNNDFWHSDNFSGSSDSDRFQMTRGPIGMPDLNTGSSGLQDIICKFLSDAQKCGADGFRFDAAKHIETPTDDSNFASQFWAKVASTTKANDPDVFLYGEILNTAGPGNYIDVQKYTPYIRVTNNLYGHTVQSSVKDWKADYVKNLHGYNGSGANIFGDNGKEWVLWNESHDTFAGEYGDKTNGYSEEQMTFAWCAVAARYPAALYFSRPTSMSAPIGSHTMTYTDKRIAAMNKFHNYFAGQTEYSSVSDNILVVERGTEGVALVNYNKGSKTVSIKMNKMKDGTYTDQVTGNEFEVTNGTLTGTIGDGGIAAIYNAVVVKTPKATISKEGGSFSTDTLELTLGLKNATSGTYKIGDVAAVTYTGTKTITIGSDMSFGDSVTVTLTATDGTDTTTAGPFTFTKQEKTSNIAYVKVPSSWGDTVYCYAYDDSGATTVKNAEWPGDKMTYRSETGLYEYEVPENVTSPKIIFTNNNGSQYPGSQKPGLELSGSMVCDVDAGTWKAYESPVEKGTVTVKYVDESGKEIKTATTQTGEVGSAYSTTAATIDGYTLKTTPANSTGTYTKETITVTYVYEKAVVPTEPTVTPSVASGQTFTTETKEIVLSLSNATSGTYSIDNGPVVTFTSDETIVIGQGKIGDSVVTVSATATDGTKTKEYEFTYNKKFVKTVDETVDKAAAVTLDSQYATNKVGFGKKKTITVDGTLSDWTSDMLIAQGAANDDPRVYRPNSMYENPIDLYALYGAYDDKNLYLMWEMTNVQDVVAPDDNYPLSQGVLWKTENFPFFLAIDTKDSETKIGNNCNTADGELLWDIDVSFTQNVNKIIAFSTKPGANGPYVYGGDSTGIDALETHTPATSGITYKGGLGILSSKVMGIDGAYGEYNNRVVGDMTKGATYIDFNEKGHNSSSGENPMDFCYEMSIPLETIGVTASDIASKGIGVMLAATNGKSGMDCLPYDFAMNDNADKDDSANSQENNSFEKSDADVLTVPLATIGAGDVPPSPADELEVNFGADRSAPQTAGTKLTLKGIATGGSGSYTYSIYADDELLTSGTAKTCSKEWTPQAGMHVIKCVVSDSKGNTKTSAKYFKVTGGEVADLSVSLTLSKSEIEENESVTLIAAATGGAGSYTYKYQVANQALTEYADITGTGTTATWTGNEAGTRYLVVTVTDAKGATATDKKLITINKKQTGFSVSLALSSDSIAPKASVDMTATATGGTGTLQYKYQVANEALTSFVTIKRTSSNKCTWTSSTAGTRYLIVTVTDANGATATDKKLLNIVSSSSIKATLTLSSDKIEPRSLVSLKTQVTGATGMCTYKFEVANKELTKKVTIKGQSTSSTCTWKSSTAGERYLIVTVTDKAGNVTTDKKLLTICSSALDVSLTLSKDSINAGESVKLTTTVSGATGALKYKYQVANRTLSAYATICGQTSAGSITWKSSTSGIRYLIVTVTDELGNSATVKQLLTIQ